MTRRVLVMLALSFATAPATAAAAAPGDLDPAFSGDGIASLGDPDVAEAANAVAVQPDGKVVVAGRNGDSFLVVRLTAAGTPDPAFSADGQQVIDISPAGATEAADAVAIQPDGKIVVAGDAGTGIGLARLNPDGSFDAGFAGDGVRSSLEQGVTGDAAGLVLQPDGRIVVAGGVGGDVGLLRYNADGTPDATFSGDGVQSFELGGTDAATAVAGAPGGALVVAARSTTANVSVPDTVSGRVLRVNPDGALDSGFTGDGVLEVPVPTDLALRPDGRLVVQTGFEIRQFTAAGNLDTTFGRNGAATDAGAALALDGDGRIVTVASGPDGPAIARRDPTGPLDATFSDDGRRTVGVEASASGVALTPEGSIVVVGTAASGEGDIAVARLLAAGDPLPPPEAGETVNLAADGGILRVRPPGESRFRRIRDGEQLPVGTAVDVTAGRVSLTAAGAGSAVQTASFYGGRFRIGQSAGRIPVTELRLDRATGCRARASVAQAKRKKTNGLWGSSRGRFVTRGRYGSAAVRGTEWLTRDQCGGTFFKVAEGVVTVRDFGRRKTVVLRAPRSYLARGRR